MTQYVIDPPAVTAVPVAGGGLFPVRRVFCVGRNYAEHTREMGGDPDREEPFFFTKPADALLINGADMPYPTKTKDLHHEMELVVAIGTGGKDIAEADALAHVYGYAAGLDMTRRDLQIAYRVKQRPWSLGKAFEQSAPIAEITKAADYDAIGPQRIALSVGGDVRQDAHLSDMVWSVPEIISHLSQFYHLVPGDLIFTGTPAGVGPVVSGDSIHGEIDGLQPIDVVIGDAA